MGAKATNRDRTITLSEGERLILRKMLIDKAKWIRATAQAFGLDPATDAVSCRAILETFERKLGA